MKATIAYYLGHLIFLATMRNQGWAAGKLYPVYNWLMKKSVEWDKKGLWNAPDK